MLARLSSYTPTEVYVCLYRNKKAIQSFNQIFQCYWIFSIWGRISFGKKKRLTKPKHIKNATWPEGCGQRNEKTRKRENQKTEKTEKTRKREIENQKTGTLLAVFGLSSFLPFSRFRVFAVFAFSRFPRFRGFLVFAVFAFSPFSRPQVDSSRFRVFGFSRFRVHRCFHMFSPGVFVPQNGLLRYILYTCPKL